MSENVREIFEGLNPQQKEAVSQTEGPVLIVAGAGSGKTRVLTCRIANILSKGTPAERVLSLTFTKKAAAQMKERVASMVGFRTARGVVMGTFHSVFIRFLRDYAGFLGYPRDFTIYDASDSQSLVKTCLKELNLDEKVYKPRTVLGRIGEAKNALVSPAAYVANAAAVERDRNAKMPRLSEVYDLYWRKCRESGVMDFDDILFEMNILLRDNPEALQEISSRFDYILVDEYQDTNRAQYIILKKLGAAHRNVCVVGDDSQSIYAFRGARIENILNFKKDYPDCMTFRLEQNYRSTRTIVDAANSVIAHNEGRIPKTCFSEGDAGEKIRLIKAYTEQEEAMLVVSAIAEIIRSEGAQYQDFAVLYRTNAQSRALEEALRRRNFPYLIFSGNSFFERAEVKDLMAYFKLAVNPSDDESFKRIVNKPARGIGDTSLSALIMAAYDKGLTLMKAIREPDLERYGLKAAAVSKFRQFADMVMRWNARMSSENAYTLAMDIALESLLWTFYKSDTSIEGQARFGNVEELCNSIQAFIEEREAIAQEDGQDAGIIPLSEYLENIALLSAVDVDDEDSANKVALMTVHTSKGLEFPYVFIVGLEENLFPSGGPLARVTDIEEERRLFYVALTRAMKRVQLSFAVMRMRNGRSESNPVSRFIIEIDPKYISNPLDNSVREVGAESFFSSINNFSSGKTLRQMSDEKRPGGTPTQRGNAATNAAKAQSRNFFNGFLGSTPSSRPVTQAPEVRTPDALFEPSPIADLRVGQRVEHNRFGFGKLKEIVRDPSGDKVKIRFDEFGEKVLLLKYAKIRIV